MNVKVYNSKENYDNFKDEILSDFNYFFSLIFPVLRARL